MKKIVAFASAAVLGLGLAACDSAAENQAEENIEEMEDARDAEVNQMEADGVITDEQADAMDDQTDAMEESMEEQADNIDGM
ncbi:hypothetical protein [Aurantiacibacter rhizosphaerae]|uniref:Uncharacterized protein n=1 Tax=Aurantiacibacter rhizosphaerae TaxID=2691582 RepID=A0A844X9P6_9SPHN|nr:hypothetical protein [Aurantiacibacter rhizosphaerae]MWV26550.1 hypothetical protein [Aurantiacibacter rhizosphaerae]